MELTNNRRRSLFIYTGALFTILVLAAALSIASVLAEPTPTPAPPFEGVYFEKTVSFPERAAEPLAAADLTASVESFTDTFEAPLPPSSLWFTFDADLADGGVHQWGRESVAGIVENGPSITGTMPSPHTHAMWAIGGGEDGGALKPASDTYPAGIDSWLVYGPINLQGVSGASIQFDYWYDGVSGDSFSVGVSDSSGIDTHTFVGLSKVTTGEAQWKTSSFPLDNYLGKQTVYIGFNFFSGASGAGRKGAFLDNFLLTIAPPRETYLAVVRNDPTPTPLPTPTATPIVGYQDDFNADIAGWEDRERDLFEGTKNVITHDNNAYLGVEVQEKDDYTIVSPLVVGPVKPYAAESRVRFLNAEDEDEFGIVFGADWDTTEPCPDPDEKFLTCFNQYYLLSIRWREGGDAGDALEARIVRVDSQTSQNNQPIYTLLRPAIRLDPGQINPNDWNTWRVVVESDNDMKVFINGVENTALKATDSRYTGQRYFGLLVRSDEDFAKVQFDYFNITPN